MVPYNDFFVFFIVITNTVKTWAHLYEIEMPMMWAWVEGNLVQLFKLFTLF